MNRRAWQSDSCPSALTAEESMFLEVVDGFTATEVEPSVPVLEREGAGFPADLATKLRDQEFASIAVPEELGGTGGSRILALLTVERLASVSAATAIHVGLRQAATAARVAAGLTDEAADAVFAGGHPLDLDGGRLTGVVSAAALAGADRCVVLGRPDSDSAPVALTIAVIDTEVRATPARTGLRSAWGPELRVDALEPLGDLGPEGAVAGSVHRLLAIAFGAVGVGRAAIDAAATYLQGRRQFGRPLADFGALRRLLADDVARSDAAAALADAAAAGAPDPRLAAEVARRACVEAVAIAEDAIQLHGGYGYVVEYPPERLLRDALSLRAMAGAGGHAVAAERLLTLR